MESTLRQLRLSGMTRTFLIPARTSDAPRFPGIGRISGKSRWICMKARDLDARFDSGEDIGKYLPRSDWPDRVSAGRTVYLPVCRASRRASISLDKGKGRGPAE